PNPVLLHPHHRPLEGPLPAPGPGRAGRPAPRGTAAPQQRLDRRGGQLDVAADPAGLRLAAQPLVLPDAGPAPGAAAPRRGQPRERPPLASPSRPRLAPAPARAEPYRSRPRRDSGGAAGAAARPAGRRDGGVPGRGGPEPQPGGRLHVDGQRPAGPAADAGRQREVSPGRLAALADRGPVPDGGAPAGRGLVRTTPGRGAAAAAALPEDPRDLRQRQVPQAGGGGAVPEGA